MIKNKRILVTGGGGSIGSELVRQLSSGNKIYILDINETAMFDLYEEQRLGGFDVKGRVGDIRNRYTVEEVFENFKPQVVFHAAALKHVTPSEHDPDETILTNELGTLNLTKAAHKYAVEKFIFISSDKAVNPTTVYGCSKRQGENIVRNAGYIIVRFANVLGSRGSLIPIWEKQINEKKPLTVTDEKMERYFMSIQDACTLVIEATEKGEPGQTMILDMGKPIKIIDLARRMVEEMKSDVPIKFIGMRPGEALTEKLMTPEEEARAVKKDNFYVFTN